MRNLALMWVLAACLVGCDGKPPVSTFTDTRDGKVYKIVKIGSQTWFAENLNYAAEGSKCYGEGGKSFDKLYGETLTDAEIQANCAKYGRLYDWETALTACPDGTHLPTDEEWAMLENYVGDSSTIGRKLKARSGWDYYGNGTNKYGFSALPGGYGGYRYSDGYFVSAGLQSGWWSATEIDTSNAWLRYMNCIYEYVERIKGEKTTLFSVRCVQDNGKKQK
jgi:uncharacterized protein (TIGR02145 family)